MKEALKNDRARIQVGRISSFGLMEMSRQRLRTGVLEASTRTCPHCEGTGLVRTAASAGLSALRLIEDEAARGRGSLLTLRASQEAAIYVLNRKRADIAEIEDRYGVSVEVLPDREEEGAHMSVEAAGPPPAYAPKIEALVVEEEEDDFVEEADADEEEIEDIGEPRAERSEREGGEERDDREGGGRKRRRRRRGRGRREHGEGEAGTEAGGEEPETEPNLPGLDEEAEADANAEPEGADEFVGAAPVEGQADPQEGGDASEGGRRRRGRRGRRGGRRSGGDAEAAIAAGGEDDVPAPEAVAEEADAADAGPVTSALALAEEAAPKTAEAAEVAEAPEAPAKAPRTRRRPSARAAAAAEAEAPAAETTPVEVAAEEPAPKPRRSRRKAADATPATDATDQPAATEEAPAAKPRRSRRKAEPSAEAVTPAEPPVAATPEALETATPTGRQDVTAPVEASPVTIDDSAAGEEATGDQGTAPARRGWWQRTFGA
jgi:ribonuclease E